VIGESPLAWRENEPTQSLLVEPGVDNSTTVVAVDVGASTIKGARITAEGVRLAQLTAVTGSGQPAIDQIIDVCQDLADISTVAVAVAVPGIIDVATGAVRYAANLGWRDVPLRRLVADRLRLPVIVTHDVRAACVAESTVGLGRGVDNLLVVVIGTGIATGIIANGQPIIGATGSAGEFGHMPIRPYGEPCACGQMGCLEVYASAAGITRRYKTLGGDPTFSAASIAGATDPLAQNVWAEATRTLGQALAAATMLIDPSLIILGGGLSRAGERLAAPVRAVLKHSLSWRNPPDVVISQLGTVAGQTGAAIEAWRSTGRNMPLLAWRRRSSLGVAERGLRPSPPLADEP
jgi:glucokinase